MMTLKYLSICSGIEAASAAWHVLGWEPVAFAEIEAFPCDVLAARYPEVPNLGDMTRYEEWPVEMLAEVDLLVGGTPCQAFSVAGARESLMDDRGNLTLTYAKLLNRIDGARALHGRPPALCLWENVPGVLSTHDNAYGCFLGLLAGEDVPLTPPGGRWSDAGYVRGPGRTIAWRCLDAQYFGLAQRRDRVFVVASAREFGVEEILFESSGLRRDSAPCRGAGEGVTGTLGARTQGGGGLGTDFELGGGLIPEPFFLDRASFNQGENAQYDAAIRNDGVADALVARGPHAVGQMHAEVCGPLCSNGKAAGSATGQDAASGMLVLMMATGQASAEVEINMSPTLNCNHEQPIVALGFNARQDPDWWEERTGPLDADGGSQAVAFNLRGREGGAMPEVDEAGLLSQRAASGGSSRSYVAQEMSVRRITPRECERLQGFPDDYTLIDRRGKPAADGPRYKALGNSKAVPVVRWLGRRIAAHLTQI